MSTRILTREQLAELAALETTQGPWIWTADRWGRAVQIEAPFVGIVASCAGSLHGDVVLSAAAPDLLATARDLQRRLDLRESALSDAGADLHALTEEARELGPNAHPDGAPNPERIRAAVLAALAEVHVEPPTWAGAVADDVLARLQASSRGDA